MPTHKDHKMPKGKHMMPGGKPMKDEDMGMGGKMPMKPKHKGGKRGKGY